MKNFPIFAVILISVLLVSCAQTKTVTVTEYRDRVQKDTITRTDSVYVSRVVREKGDTIYVTDTLLRFKYLDRTRDVYVHDSIPYKVEVVKEVRKRNGYDRFTSWGFWIFIVLISLRVGWWFFKTFYLRKI